VIRPFLSALTVPRVEEEKSFGHSESHQQVSQEERIIAPLTRIFMALARIGSEYSASCL
jgi:hypothetical protein